MLDTPSNAYSPRVNFTGRARTQISIKVACATQGGLFLRSAASPTTVLMRKLLGFSTADVLTETIESNGIDQASIARLRNDAVFMQNLSILIDEAHLSVALRRGTLTASGRSKIARRDIDRITRAVVSVTRRLDELNLALSEVRSANLGYLLLMGLAILPVTIMLLGHSLVGPINPLSAARLVKIGLALGALLFTGYVAAFSRLLRTSPSVWAVFSRGVIAAAALSLLDGIAVVNFLNAVVPTDKLESIPVSGSIVADKSKGVTYRLVGDYNAPITAFGVDANSISLQPDEARALLGPGNDATGLFEVTIRQGYLGEPLVVKVRRAISEGRSE